jgi:uncharacterized protein YegP (UPF0339 family)
MALTYPCYWIRKDSKEEWYWVYYAKNGEAIGRSSESYKDYDDCYHGIELMKGSGNDTVFVTK